MASGNALPSRAPRQQRSLARAALWGCTAKYTPCSSHCTPGPACCRQVVGSTDIDDGEGMFQWLISPVDTETFYEAIHEVRSSYLLAPGSP